MATAVRRRVKQEEGMVSFSWKKRGVVIILNCILKLPFIVENISNFQCISFKKYNL